MHVWSVMRGFDKGALCSPVVPECLWLLLHLVALQEIMARINAIGPPLQGRVHALVEGF